MKKKKWNLSSEDCITNRKLGLETNFLLKWSSSDKQYIKKIEMSAIISFTKM